MNSSKPKNLPFAKPRKKKKLGISLSCMGKKGSNGFSIFSKKAKSPNRDNTWANGLWKSFGYDPTWCKCGARMEINYDLSDFKGGCG